MTQLKLHYRGVSAFPPYNDEDEIIMPDNYGLMLDNCMFPLRDCKTIERLGTIYFGLDRESTTFCLVSFELLPAFDIQSFHFYQ